MNANKTSLLLALTAAIGTAGIAQAAGNPFAMEKLNGGYMVAAEKAREGKCGEGKCGAGKASAKDAEGKCGAAAPDMASMDANKDGKVSKQEFIKHHERMFGMMDSDRNGFLAADEMGAPQAGKAADGKCGEGKCGAGAKSKEGKCGEGKCGARK